MISAEYDPDDHSVALRDGENYAGTFYGVYSFSLRVIDPEKNFCGVLFKNSIGLPLTNLECIFSIRQQTVQGEVSR